MLYLVAVALTPMILSSFVHVNIENIRDPGFVERTENREQVVFCVCVQGALVCLPLVIMTDLDLILHVWCIDQKYYFAACCGSTTAPGSSLKLR